MPINFHTKIGERFGSRVITGFLPVRNSDGHLVCSWQCDCGETGTGGLKAFRHTKNCPRCRNRNQRGRPIHGHATVGKRTHLYDAWANMMQRVRGTGSPSNKKWYAGVKVCDEWQTFPGFLGWALKNDYEPGLSLDRIFVWGDYEPNNCEWVTRSENSRRAVEDRWRQHKSTPIEMLWGTV